MKRYEHRSLALLLLLPLFLPLSFSETAARGDDFSALAAFRYGEDPAVLRALEARAARAAADPAARAGMEQGLLGVVRSEAATLEARRFACRLLGLVGSPASVPVLAGLLGDPAIGEDARFGLERIPGEEGDAALLQALEHVEGRALASVIRALGLRGVRNAAAPLAALLTSANEEVRQAAVAALGRLGPAGLARLLAAEKKGCALPRAVFQEALLRAATELAASPEGEARAKRIFTRLLREDTPPAVRRGAFLRLLEGMPRPDEKTLLEPLRTGDAPTAAAVLRYLQEPGKEGLFRRALERIETFPPGIRRRLAEAVLHQVPSDAGLMETLVEKAPDPEIRRHAFLTSLEARRSSWKNLALGAKAESPDGLEKDGDAAGDGAAVDGNPETYWDETDGQPRYVLRVAFPEPRTLSALRILGWAQENFAPRDFLVTADGVPVKIVQNARYLRNVLWVFLPETTCKALTLYITGYYGGSPAVRELEVYDAGAASVQGAALEGEAGKGPFTQRGVIPEEEFEKILAAAPDRARAAPRKKRRVLVFSLAFGYKHSAIPYGKAALEVLARKTGAFEAEFSEDPAAFEKENLERFDAVVFNNTNNELFLPENFDNLTGDAKAQALARDARLKENFRSFVSRGGGLAVIHAGVASFRKWPEFGKIMGARFDNHPWGAGSTVTLRVTDPEHPAVRAFAEAPTLSISDEIYQLKEFSPDDIRVLLRVDLEKTRVTPAQRKLFHREDGLFPMTFVKRFGKGRVFYCALGHMHELYWNPVVLRHYLDGIQFVLRDLDGPEGPGKNGMTGAGKKKMEYAWARSGDGAALLCNGRPVWRLVLDEELGKAYVHPLALGDGTPLTWLSPPDHPWHRSLWFSWKYVNQVNYWEYADDMGRTEFSGEPVLNLGEGFGAEMKLRFRWHPSEGPAVLDEARTLRAAPPDASGAYHLDWEESFTALADAKLDRTPPPGAPGGKSWGGYAGLSVRLAEETAEWRIEDSEGRTGTACHGEKARWIACAFRQTAADREAGIAILDHPANPRHPTPSFIVLREDVPFVYFSPAPLFNEPLFLKKGETLNLKYRVLVIPGRPDRERIEKEWQAFAGR